MASVVNKINGNPYVYILVLNYCSLEDTLECVDAIRRNDYPHFRLLVIDNASPDGSGNVLKERIPSEEYLALPVNQGYAGGNNVGMQIALRKGAEYILIVNPDVRLAPDSIASYVEVMESDHSIGALNPIQLSPEGSSIDERFKWTIWGGDREAASLSLKPGKRWETKTLLGAAIFLSSKAIERAGMFDPLYFAYGEEQDLCRRIRYHKLKLVVTSDSPVIHLRTNENKGSDDWRLYLRLKGVYLYMLKDPYKPFYKSVLTTLWQFFSDLCKKTQPYAHHFKKSHYFKVLIWLIGHGLAIYRHLQLERRGRAHLESINTTGVN